MPEATARSMHSAQLSFSALTATLKAAGEATRLRLLLLIAEAELTVSDLTAILRQSQPRLSRHLRLLAEAGLVQRYREGSWAFFRLGERGSAADIARALIARLDPNDPIIARSLERRGEGGKRQLGRIHRLGRSFRRCFGYKDIFMRLNWQVALG